jgi:hypothetical protein
MHVALDALLFAAIVAAVFAVKETVYRRGQAKRANGTAGPMTGNLFGSSPLRRQDGRPFVNRSGFIVLSIVITGALIVSMRTEHDSVYSSTGTEALVVVGMAVIVVGGLVTWNRNHSQP